MESKRKQSFMIMVKIIQVDYRTDVPDMLGIRRHMCHVIIKMFL